MNKVVKVMLIMIAINVGVGTLICLPTLAGKGHDGGEWIGSAFIIISLGLLIQLIVGLVMLTREEWKQTGKGMVLAVGIILLVGFAVCTSTFFSFLGSR